MDDNAIVALYWARDERAVQETARKYGAYCHTVAFNVLKNRQDAEECVNDTYVQAWNAMPPQRPCALRAFLGKITRNLAINVYRAAHTKRRGGGQIPMVLEELEDCFSDGPETALEEAELTRLLDRFLRQLPQKDCCVFVRRYWYLDSMMEIAARYHMALGSVKSSLHRSRKKLKEYLEQEGIFV